jgi:hypothetical protein
MPNVASLWVPGALVRPVQPANVQEVSAPTVPPLVRYQYWFQGTSPCSTPPLLS